MTHRGTCKNKLIILDYNPNTHYEGLSLISRYEAAVILEELKDGTYRVIKNREGKVDMVITQKEVTIFMLKYEL